MQTRGSQISYNYDNGKYEYASGAEAGYSEAMGNQNIDVPATLALGFDIAKQQGWAGNYDDFTTLYGQRTASKSYNGTFTLHTFDSFFVLGGAGSRETGSIELILEAGLATGLNDGLKFLLETLSSGFEIKGFTKYNNFYWKGANGQVYLQNMLEKGANGKFIRGVQGFRNSAAIAKNISTSLKAAGKAFGFLGVGLTTYDALSDGNITWGEGAKIGIGVLTTMTPAGWVYGLTDLGFQLTSGKSLTDRIGAAIDN